jgi:8-oxo-dGTP pyrophosphatase MutT (NUDIX family)
MLLSRKVAAVCYRLDSLGSMEFLLVRNSAGTRWIFPKGTVEGRDAFSYWAAVREAWEEAGARGRIDARPLGSFRHLVRSKKTNESSVQSIVAYALLVNDTAGIAEPGRNPTWFTLEAAAAALIEGREQPSLATEAVQMLYLLQQRRAGVSP